MQVTIDVQYNIKWPKDLPTTGEGINTFRGGTPQVGTRLLERVGAKIVRGIKNNLKNSIGIRGGKLASLDERTVAEKRRLGYANPETPLRAKNILYNAIKYFSTGKSAGKVSIIKRGKPNRLDVAKWQQSGTYKGPRRVFFGINPALRHDLDRFIKEYLQAMVRRTKTYADSRGRALKKSLG